MLYLSHAGIRPHEFRPIINSLVVANRFLASVSMTKKWNGEWLCSVALLKSCDCASCVMLDFFFLFFLLRVASLRPVLYHCPIGLQNAPSLTQYAKHDRQFTVSSFQNGSTIFFSSSSFLCESKKKNKLTLHALLW